MFWVTHCTLTARVSYSMSVRNIFTPIKQQYCNIEMLYSWTPDVECWTLILSRLTKLSKRGPNSRTVQMLLTPVLVEGSAPWQWQSQEEGQLSPPPHPVAKIVTNFAHYSFQNNWLLYRWLFFCFQEWILVPTPDLKALRSHTHSHM